MNKNMKLKIFKNFDLAALVIISLLALVAFLPSFYSSFHLDDYDQLIKNNLKHISTVRVFKIFPATRWLVFLSFRANAAIHGYTPFGYHLVNFIIHIFNAFLIYKITSLLLFFIRRNGCGGAVGSSQKAVALFAAALFAVHPLQSQTVIYITQRLMLSATFFYLLSMYFFIKSYLPGKSKTKGLFLTFIFFILGALCKEIIVTLPVVLFLTLWLILEQEKFIAKIKNNKLISLGVIILVAIIPFVVFLNIVKWDVTLLKQALHSIGGALNANTPGLTRYTYALTQAKVLLKYIGLFFYPSGLQIDPDVRLCASCFSPCFFLSFIVILLLIICAWLVRKKTALFSLGILFYFIVILPQSSFIPTPDLMFEHRAYLGVAGLIWMFLGIIIFISKYLNFKSIYLFIKILAVITICLLTLLTYNRAKIWKNEISLWADAYAKSPDKPRVVNNYVNALLNNNEELKAIDILEKKLKNSEKVPPFIVTTLANLYAQNGFFSEAKDLYFKSLKADYTNPETRYNMALMCYFLGDGKKARYHALTLRRLHPENNDANFLLGMVYSMDIRNYSYATNYLSIYLQKEPNGENAESAKTIMKMLERQRNK